jgi:hypothetical protein
MLNTIKFIPNAKTLVFFILLLLTEAVYSQSVLTLGSGTSMGVLTGADLCANILNGPGIYYGGGNMCGVLVAVEPITSNELPTSFEIFQNYPNPFNPATMIKYQLPYSTSVSIKLYDQLGREVGLLYEGNQQAGYYQLTVDGKNLASGIYYCRINAADYSKVIKMSLIK